MSPIYDFLRSQMLPLKQIDKLVPSEGKILDLGCGQGVIAKYLAKTKTREVIGIDKNQERIPKSNSRNLEFQYADIRKYPLEDADAIVISDVLHHLNYQDQEKLLAKVARALKKGGILVVKEIDTEEIIRSNLSRLWDFLLYPKDKIFYHNSSDLKKYLESLGFKVIITRPSRLFPGSTTIYIAKKI